MSDAALSKLEDFLNAFSVMDSTEQAQMQQEFGRLIGVEKIPKLFKDSTHFIYKLFYSDSAFPLICKLCLPANQEQLEVDAQISFWPRVKQIFNFNACESLNYAQFNYAWFAKHSVFSVAHLHASVQSHQVGFLLQEYIEGINCRWDFYNEERVDFLSKHLLAMHAKRYSKFGVLAELSDFEVNPTDSVSQSHWWQTIEDLLVNLPAGMVSDSDRQKALNDLIQLKKRPIKFVPQLIDFRWDQLRWGVPASTSIEDPQGRFYLLDLDALLVAPLEFDWVMLELVLSEKEMNQLKKYYSQQSVIPCITEYRDVYRMVFFVMNLLDEPSWQAFKNRPKTLL